jgi:hypothetical protein
MRLIWITVIGLMMGFAPARSKAQSPEVPIQVSLCEIKAHPEKYLKKLVEFTAVASHGVEHSMVGILTVHGPDGGPRF